MQRKEREVLTLPCKLTQEEKTERGVELCDHLTKIDQHENDLQSFKKHTNHLIAEEEAKVSILKDQISTGREYREVECRIEWDWERKVKTWYRLDGETEQFVKEVPIQEHELQEYNQELAAEEERIRIESEESEAQEGDDTDEEVETNIEDEDNAGF